MTLNPLPAATSRCPFCLRKLGEIRCYIALSAPGFPAAVAEGCRSAGAGVKSVVAVDFRNGMIDGVLKQHC